MRNRKIVIVIMVLLICSMLFSNGAVAFANEKVYLGGQSIGIEVELDGLLVVGIEESYLSEKEDIQVGDVIKKANGVELKSISDLTDVLKISNESLFVELSRGEQTIYTNLKVIKNNDGKKLGLLIKDRVQGVGTLTYFKQDGSFGALGHPISASKDKTPLQISGGHTSDCLIIGVKKGEKGCAGELKGVFIKSNRLIGAIEKNNDFGIFGKFNDVDSIINKSTNIEIANKDDIKVGKAQILTTIEGDEPKYYDVEIVKTCYQDSPTTKGLVLLITDPELTNKVGGIVQGMSGSPIIQDGKLIGAVTHVFINDPKRGYGLYAEFMSNN